MPKTRRLWFTILFSLISITILSPDPVYSEKKVDIGINLYNPVQYPPSSDSVRGIRLNGFYGNNKNLIGLDLGHPLSINYLTGAINGKQIGFYNKAKSGNGSQAGSINHISKTFNGSQLGIIANKTDGRMHGGQIAPYNSVGDGAGVQIGFANYADRYLYGGQIGVVNYASGSVFGAQVGLFNLASNINGVQIGFINYHETPKRIPRSAPGTIVPFFNWSF